jgi:hypothetical protein
MRDFRDLNELGPAAGGTKSEGARLCDAKIASISACSILTLRWSPSGQKRLLWRLFDRHVRSTSKS